MIFTFFNTCEAVKAASKQARPYTAAERKMLDETNRKYDEMVGWAAAGGMPGEMTEDDGGPAVLEEMIALNKKFDYWNPLFTDGQYASNTRWGSIIAAPFTMATAVGSSNSMELLAANPDVGDLKILDGVGYGKFTVEWYRPIRPGDTFRNWNRRPVIEDITEGDGPRTFLITRKTDTINQRDELVSTSTNYVKATFYTDPGADVNVWPPLVIKELHTYTDEELAYVKQLEDGEEVRGAKIRYWEDVSIEDQLTPVVTGPTTVMDTLYHAGAGSFTPMREQRKRGGMPLLVDPDTNISHMMSEGHYGPLNSEEGGRHNGIHYNSYSRDHLARLVTNWMGDDGFLRKFHWRLFQYGIELTRDVPFLKDRKTAGHDKIGDVLIAKGMVTGKRIEAGEHLVDLLVWIEDIEGDIGTAANVTVRLLSKGEPYMEWMKDQR
jgi:acyl dehydratase